MKSRFVDACMRRSVDATPVWFMRQAGRYLPSYRKIRGEKGILSIAKDPELASSVTVDPVTQLGVDAAVLFADIMLPLEGMGVKFRIVENVGPVVDAPVRTMEDVEGLADFEPSRDVPHVLETVELAVKKLGGTPLVGFSGAPFTLAGYLVEGGPSREFTLTKRMMHEHPETWRALMEKLTRMVVAYLAAQLKSGVDAVQLFDSWAGCLSREDYDSKVAGYTRTIFRGIGSSVPRIHFCANSGGLVESFASTGCEVLSVDWRVALGDVWKRTGGTMALQGNLDPVLAVSGGLPMQEGVESVMAQVEGRNGHVFNLGHGVLKDTPPENLKKVVGMVHGRGGSGR